ncbi:MAG TPA: AzlD domain-containing protein [Candidatus Stackebrandtia excrementipullorum]|nr:AzlD domain-containing protein [Candidatus Stackebrandtia excrementipullorum]
MIVLSIVLLAVGTYAFRIAGPLLRDRINLSASVEAFIRRTATVLLVGLVATMTLVTSEGFTGLALPAGVAVGGILAWKKVPFVVIVVAAAATTALLRLAGVQ